MCLLSYEIGWFQNFKLPICKIQSLESLFKYCLVALSKNGKNDKEKIDDVNVDLEGTVNVLLWVQFMLLSPNNHLCVIDEELQINDKNINNSNKISIS